MYRLDRRSFLLVWPLVLGTALVLLQLIVRAGSAGAIAAGLALLGFVAGVQSYLLRPALPRAWRWGAATLGGGVVAYGGVPALGFLWARQAGGEPEAILWAVLVSGAVGGLCLGIAQAGVLKAISRRAASWIWISVMAAALPLVIVAAIGLLLPRLVPQAFAFWFLWSWLGRWLVYGCLSGIVQAAGLLWVLQGRSPASRQSS